MNFKIFLLIGMVGLSHEFTFASSKRRGNIEELLEQPALKVRGKKYICPICDKAVGHLTNHVRIHTGEKPFVCTWQGCGASFAQSGQLKNHMCTHTGKKNFMCAVCGHSTITSTQLDRHILTHTGEKPYKCEWPACTSAFISSDKLNIHMRSHTGEKPFKCNECSYASSVSSNLIAHKKRHAKNSTHAVVDAQTGPLPLLVSISASATTTQDTQKQIIKRAQEE